mgnify:CR=1 FL=1
MSNRHWRGGRRGTPAYAPPGQTLFTGVPARKIVVLRHGARVSDEFLAVLGAQVYRRFSLINAVVVELSADAHLLALTRTAEIERVDDDLELFMLEARRESRRLPDWGDITSGLQRCLQRRCRSAERSREGVEDRLVPWGVEAVGAPSLWKKSQGDGVRVAVLDTGADPDHPALRDNLGAGYNALRPGYPPLDDNGHGTHVSGTVAASGSGAGLVGVAPRAKVEPVKILDRNGSGRLSDMIAGLDWAVRHRVDIVNLSLGTAADNQTLRDAVREAASRLVIVAAAGNSGPGADTVSYPARYDEVVAVGAVDRNERVARFSSRGSEVDFLAPGVNILSTWPQDGMNELSGTSMATPHVAGALALLLAAGFAPGQAVDQLRAQARHLPGVPETAQGRGIVHLSLKQLDLV